MVCKIFVWWFSKYFSLHNGLCLVPPALGSKAGSLDMVFHFSSQLSTPHTLSPSEAGAEKRRETAFSTSQGACLLGGWSLIHLSKLWGPSEPPLLFFPILRVIYPMSSFFLIQIDLKLVDSPFNSCFKMGYFQISVDKIPPVFFF